jgi:phospholipid transport system substrate-binding protein
LSFASSLLIFALSIHPPCARAEEPSPEGPAVNGVAAEGPSPREVVEKLHGGLLEAMKRADEYGFQGRYDYIEPIVAETFDLEFMGSKSVGRHWKKLSPEDKQLWLKKFLGYLAANYAGNFTDYGGEQFHTLGDEPAKRDTRVVLTKLQIPGDEDVIFNYRLRKKAGEWKIIDIYLKGTVSELALRRSDFSTTLKQKGFANLTTAVDRKIAELRDKGGG